MQQTKAAQQKLASEILIRQILNSESGQTLVRGIVVGEQNLHPIALRIRTREEVHLTLLDLHFPYVLGEVVKENAFLRSGRREGFSVEVAGVRCSASSKRLKDDREVTLKISGRFVLRDRLASRTQSATVEVQDSNSVAEHSGPDSNAKTADTGVVDEGSGGFFQSRRRKAAGERYPGARSYWR